jgi:beta-galactosidase
MFSKVTSYCSSPAAGIANREEITAMRLGVCYYPEQWPEAWWADDARRMAEMGLTRVRIGEFAWSRIEPEPGRYDWAWLDRAVETLHAAGLGIIMGTPTATPPKWLVDQMPDMVAIDADGRPRKFGSRRHYCFSHPGYHAQAARIVSAMATRYGSHPAIVAWQTDNEYGCHDTVISYSDAAAAGFRLWLGDKYDEVDALNKAWGAVFWSQEYRSFGEIEPPNLTVTEPNPAHILDYRQFASDEVVRFNRMQADILRAGSPGRDVVHNFMGFFNDFDHHAVSRDLDVATWDSYPLGFLEQFWFPAEEKLRYARQGHPDIAAFHHDLYRGCSQDGRWWVMEQQPGPVNWARFNPAPLPGMVRLWSLEAMAHGAELVSYFRWRQAPFAQEQMHSGLLRPDSSDDVGAGEARQTSQDIGQIGDVGLPERSVALIYSYEAEWVCRTQPQGASFRYPELAFNFYTALRRLGLSVDIVAPDADLSGYKMVVAPSLPILSEAQVATLAALPCPVLLGPRTGSKTPEFAIPANLAPGPLQSALPIRVVRVESLRDGMSIAGAGFEVTRWTEHVESKIVPEIETSDGRGVVYAQGNLRYVAAWPDANLLARLFVVMAQEGGIAVTPLPADLRLRAAGDHRFAFNYGLDTIDLADVLVGAEDCTYLVGSRVLPPAGVAVWREV